ncbi:ubiquitin-conjugating enzyme E2 J1 isoform X2 [Protopterus annectens]|nr:ubiquitin-conjugating enzyme E2 J1 isoform X2 [Protopterus annectens]
MKEAAELREPTQHFHAQPLEDNLFEWHFSVRGPPDSDFDGGVYHGRIVLPPEYPMKPPSIILLTPNGRFEIGKKICLSISGHHPETWQPSWSIRTALLAIIGFMPTKGEGAIGSLDYTPEERKCLAKRSLDFCCDVCNACMRTTLTPMTVDSSSSKTDMEAKELARQISFKAEVNSTAKPEVASAQTLASSNVFQGVNTPTQEVPTTVNEPKNTNESTIQEPAQHTTTNRSMSPRQRRAQRQNQQARVSPAPVQVQQPIVNTINTGSTMLIAVLALALAALIFRRVYLANEYKFDYDL